MFDSIRGTLRRSEPTCVVVEAAGLGYEIQVPLSTYEALPATDAEVCLLLHPVIRETEWRLFGFLTESERNVFRALVKVNGVGPMMAVALLSGLKPGEFRAAVMQGDVKALTRVKGIGKKTAERILVELKDVVAREGGAVEAIPEAALSAAPDVVQDAVQALLALGMDAPEARRRVTKHAEAEDLTVSELVRRALRSA